MSEVKYFHDEVHHNLRAPSIIVPYLVETINPKSVVDVGCGIGTFLHMFNRHGVMDFLGLDGEWLNTELAQKYISLDKLKIVDLEQIINLDRRFDLAVSLEVAEHIEESSADVFVKNITSMSDVIIFSAAFPGQGGQNHVNEQWPSYWADKFSSYSYGFYDVLRPLFWENKEIDIWYRQNLFLVIKKGKEHIAKAFEEKSKSQVFINVIHPEIFQSHFLNSQKLGELSDKMDVLLKGKADFKTYVKISLKFLLRKIGLYNK